MTSKFHVDDDTIVVLSIPLHYVSEESGDKRNTIRKRTAQEVAEACVEVHNGMGEMFVNGKHIRNIRVINDHTGARFERELTNVCVYEDTFIYSW